MAPPVRLNALVVGSGWAQHAATAFAAREDVCVAGLVARGSPRSIERARALGVPLFDSLADAIHATAPSLAVVAVSDDANARLASDLLRADVHVLCAHPVARTGEGVEELAMLAAERRLVISTDYSLRTTESFRAAQSTVAALGSLLRTEITFPGRFLPMALDLAIAFGGRVEALSAFGRYPEELRSRRDAAPAAFPPTVVLEHARGAVTALTPSPHASPLAAMRVTASCTAGRVELELPAGAARRIHCKAGGAWEDITLVPPRADLDPASCFEDAMRALANAFVDAVIAGGPPPCPLEDEAHVRRLWLAIPRALRTRMPIVLDELQPRA